MRPCLLLVPLALVGCAGSARGPGGEPLPNPIATAALENPAGRQVGLASFTRADSGARLGISVSGLTPGGHGTHIHAVGSCTSPDFKSAGPHFNPEGKHHGLKNPAGPHAGDLPNLMVGSDGSADTTFTLDPALLGTGPTSIFQSAGTAVVIHAGPDDGRSDPAGNSGDRIACGVVERR